MRVEYINHMGSDLTVVNAARVSFDKESELVDIYGYEHPDNINRSEKEKIVRWYRVVGKGLSEKDQKLIKYLASHNHWTPFSHVMITMRETVPIFVARQRFKHMVGFTYNEVSRRYVDDEPEFFVPDVWRGKPENAKQGSSDIEIKDMYAFLDRDILDRSDLKERNTVNDQYEFFLRISEGLYKAMIKAGVAPEQARMVLPQSMYTSYYVTGSLAAWARAYKLRTDPHAQKEIQNLAKMWDDVISNIKGLEYSWKVLTE